MSASLAKALSDISASPRKGRPMMFLEAMAERQRREAKRATASAATLTVTKAVTDPERRTITGWASVCTIGGEPVIDLQGDAISIDEIRMAAHQFMRGPRRSLLAHAGEPVGEVVESVVLDSATQAAMGIDLGREGWLVTVFVSDDDAWVAAKNGTLASFSIGGWAVRE